MIEIILAAALASSVKSDAQIQYEALVPLAMLNYRTCLTLKTADYAKTGESVATVVDAAFGACVEYRSELSSLPKKVGLQTTIDATEHQLSWVDEQERKRLTAFVLEFRAKP